MKSPNHQELEGFSILYATAQNILTLLANHRHGVPAVTWLQKQLGEMCQDKLSELERLNAAGVEWSYAGEPNVKGVLLHKPCGPAVEFPNKVSDGCPNCGEEESDNLVWMNDSDWVTCWNCKTIYSPVLKQICPFKVGDFVTVVIDEEKATTRIIGASVRHNSLIFRIEGTRLDTPPFSEYRDNTGDVWVELHHLQRLVSQIDGWVGPSKEIEKLHWVKAGCPPLDAWHEMWHQLQLPQR